MERSVTLKVMSQTLSPSTEARAVNNCPASAIALPELKLHPKPYPIDYERNRRPILVNCDEANL
jgi:hypothetical protein